MGDEKNENVFEMHPESLTKHSFMNIYIYIYFLIYSAYVYSVIQSLSRSCKQYSFLPGIRRTDFF